MTYPMSLFVQLHDRYRQGKVALSLHRYQLDLPIVSSLASGAARKALDRGQDYTAR